MFVSLLQKFSSINSFFAEQKPMEYRYLFHALKNTANQRPGLPLHILRYVTGNMQRVVFHSTFPSLLARNSLLGSFWGLLKNQLRNFEFLRTVTNISNHVRKFFDDFQTLLKISKDFTNISKNHKTSEKHFWMFSEVCRKFPKISEDFRRFSENF